jgi:carboxyl-terminal processing protease
MLEKTLQPDLDRDLKKFREEITMLLRNEIVSRYYFQRGSSIASIEDDKTIAKAKEILANNPGYRQILLPD